MDNIFEFFSVIFLRNHKYLSKIIIYTLYLIETWLTNPNFFLFI